MLMLPCKQPPSLYGQRLLPLLPLLLPLHPFLPHWVSFQVLSRLRLLPKQCSTLGPQVSL